ncbi:hypothetical protein GGQ76_003861 [Aureimonas jatrophae]|uniref:Uncharacterized protein n=1 Tax=Aureimonas jatrophae TaxID=1166073 RepID=A0A1H0LJV1_9HYPH|nr:hypothetical protein [Aureimonas jatrophae]SDO68190.1 hypothetical protein SAMN05192530_11059 [Aureimonas jatrophae]
MPRRCGGAGLRRAVCPTTGRASTPGAEGSAPGREEPGRAGGVHTPAGVCTRPGSRGGRAGECRRRRLRREWWVVKAAGVARHSPRFTASRGAAGCQPAADRSARPGAGASPPVPGPPVARRLRSRDPVPGEAKAARRSGEGRPVRPRGARLRHAPPDGVPRPGTARRPPDDPVDHPRPPKAGDGGQHRGERGRGDKPARAPPHAGVAVFPFSARPPCP